LDPQALTSDTLHITSSVHEMQKVFSNEAILNLLWRMHILREEVDVFSKLISTVHVMERCSKRFTPLETWHQKFRQMPPAWRKNTLRIRRRG